MIAFILVMSAIVTALFIWALLTHTMTLLICYGAVIAFELLVVGAVNYLVPFVRRVLQRRREARDFPTAEIYN